jgi:hypothetical protein
MTSDNMRRRGVPAGAGAGGWNGRHAPAIAAAARRLCERFAEQLNPLIGDAGVAAICARSLHLTERNVPGLAPVRASDQGDAPFALLQWSLEQQAPACGHRGCGRPARHVSELLALFIGEGLTTRLLREAWPDDFAGDTTEETIT